MQPVFSRTRGNQAPEQHHHQAQTDGRARQPGACQPDMDVAARQPQAPARRLQDQWRAQLRFGLQGPHAKPLGAGREQETREKQGNETEAHDRGMHQRWRYGV